MGKKDNKEVNNIAQQIQIATTRREKRGHYEMVSIMKSKKNDPNISYVQKISNLTKNILTDLNCIGENIAIGKNNDPKGEKIVMSLFL